MRKVYKMWNMCFQCEWTSHGAYIKGFFYLFLALPMFVCLFVCNLVRETKVDELLYGNI